MQPFFAVLLKTSRGGNIYQTPNHQKKGCGEPNRRLGWQRGDQNGRKTKRKYPDRDPPPGQQLPFYKVSVHFTDINRCP